MNNFNQTTIRQSDLPDTIQSLLIQNGYETLEQVLAIPLTDFIEMNWFSPDMLTALHALHRDSKTQNA